MGTLSRSPTRSAASFSHDHSTVLSPVLLITTELSLDEKLEPLDLLPLLDPLDDESVSIDSEMVNPVLPPEFENPGSLD